MKIHRNIILLGLVSLFTDLSSQMIYPLVPKLLTNLGASLVLIGIIEGIAEATASLFKPLAGRLSDRSDKRVRFVFLGYGLSSIVKPLFALAGAWTHVLALRFIDRIGKAVRNPPRDVLVSISSKKGSLGKAFGIHRAFDRIGSVGGPLIALAVLYFYPEDLSVVFLLAGIPAFLALIFIFGVKEQSVVQKAETTNVQNDTRTNPSFRYFLVANVIFTLGNSSNAFLILKASEVGFSTHQLPMIWAVYNIVCAISSPIFGTISDRLGRTPVIVTSFAYYSLVYALFAFTTEAYMLWILFGFYGIYYGLSKGVFKAYIADVTPVKNRGWHFGVFDMWTGIALLIASVLMGVLWESFNSQVAFLTSSFFSLLGLIVFLVGRFKHKPSVGTTAPDP